MSEKINVVSNVKKSYGRCLSNGDLISTFYDIFLASNPRIKARFVNTDFTKQKALLRHGLNLVIMFKDGDIASQSGLTRIRESHSKRAMNIHPEWYSLWKESLIQAVKKHDRLYDRQLEVEWRKVLDYAIDFIKSGY